MTSATPESDNAHSSAPVTVDTTHFHPLYSQVGGHAGVMTTEDGQLIIKPCLPKELEFYNLLAVDERLAPLRPFVPKMYGMLKQMDPAEGAAALEGGGLDPGAAQKILEVLGNICASFSEPAIMDLKLGTVYYDEDASPEKKAKKIADAAETTAVETGAKITGFQVFDHNTKATIAFGREYGKSLKASDLPSAMRAFFRLTTSTSEAPVEVGLPKPILTTVLSGLIADIQHIRDTLDNMEFRMVNASLLVVYEQDWDAARAALVKDTARQASRAENEENDEEEESDEEEDEEDERRLYAVKLIDFAHTKLTPGRGKDEGVILGLDTTLRLLRGRLEEVQ